MQKNQKALIRHNLIYEKLKAGEVLNVKTLAAEFGVGERTIQKVCHHNPILGYVEPDVAWGD